MVVGVYEKYSYENGVMKGTGDIKGAYITQDMYKRGFQPKDENYGSTAFSLFFALEMLGQGALKDDDKFILNLRFVVNGYGNLGLHGEWEKQHKFNQDIVVLPEEKINIEEYKQTAIEFKECFQVFKKLVHDNKPVKREFLQHLNIGMKHLQTEYRFDSSAENITNKLIPKNIFGVAYLQMHDIVFNNWLWKTCIECGSGFFANNYNSKFCPGYQRGQRNSDCQNKYNQRKFRAKKNWEKGFTPEELAKKHKRPQHEIEEWIKEWES